MYLQTLGNKSLFRRWYTGDAWLSSARVVRRPLKCGNERNPCRMLHVSYETASALQGRKERTTSSQHVPYIWGYTHPTMEPTAGSDGVTPSQSSKRSLSSDCRLQFACMKSESVVIANQQVAVNTFSLLVHTARQASKVSNARSGEP